MIKKFKALRRIKRKCLKKTRISTKTGTTMMSKLASSSYKKLFQGIKLFLNLLVLVIALIVINHAFNTIPEKTFNKDP